MSRKTLRQTVQHWREEPAQMAMELSAVLAWIEQHSVVAETGGAGESQSEGGRVRAAAAVLVQADRAAEGLRRVQEVSEPWQLYCEYYPHSLFSAQIFTDLEAALQQAVATGTAVRLAGFEQVQQTVRSVERWAASQQVQSTAEAHRSELLKTTIQQEGDELLVLTDQDGSLKLRGAANIPMFLAFWNARGHRLSRDSFLDIDRSVKPVNLERHRNRLSAKLQDVLIEIAEDKGGFQMRKSRR